MPTPQIRQITPGDRAAWLRLRRALWPRCSTRKHNLEIRQLLESGGSVFVAADKRRKVIGFAEVSLRRDHVDGASICPVPYLEAWFVRPSSRCKGIGAALLTAVENWAASRRYAELASDAELTNTLSIKLHKRFGF